MTDDGEICSEICKDEHAMIEVLGDYLQDIQQSDPVRSNILMILSNMCAEENENIKETVLQRGHFLDFF